MSIEPPTIETLALRAKLDFGPSFPAKSWCSAAVKLLDQAKANDALGKKEDAFVNYLKVSNIVIEIVPHLKDFDQVKKESTYLSLKKNVIDVLEKMETLKAQLKEARRVYDEKRRGSFSSQRSITPVAVAGLNGSSASPSAPFTSDPARSAPPLKEMKPPRTILSGEELDFLNQPSAFVNGTLNRTPVASSSAPPAVSSGPPTPSTITPEKVFDYISTERVSVLFLDMRGMEPYARGHIAWRRPKWIEASRNGKATKEVWEEGTVCCMEPEWFAKKSEVNANILEQRLHTTSFLSSPSPFAFRKRSGFNLVVYLDQSSTDPSSQPMFDALVRVLWEEASPEARTSRKPALLAGGFDAWCSYVATKPGGEMSWTEVGDGWGGLDIDGKCEPDGTMGNKNPNGDKENLALAKAKAPEPLVQDRSILRSVHDYIGNPSARSNMPQPSAPSYSQTFAPQQQFPPSTALAENNFSRVNSAPILAPKPTLSRGGSGSATRFDDPFYGFGFNYPALQAVEAAAKTLSPTDTNFAASSLPAFIPHGTSPGTPPQLPPSQMGSNGFKPGLPPPLTPKPSALVASSNQPRPSAPPMPMEPPPPIPPPPIGGSNMQRSVTFPPPIPTKPPSISGAGAAQMFVPRATSPSLTGGPTRYLNMGPGRSSAGPAIPPKPDHLSSANYTSSGAGAETQIGLTGLRNLGNTCFMNSTIQCLSGTVSLARFFLDGSYRHSLNRYNSLGTGGVVADGFAALIRTMWQAQLPFVSPTDFREAICRFAPQFRGNEQHDSQEFLSFLMDAIHEDLNVARQRGMKPPPPMTKAEEEAEEALPEPLQSKRAWERYLKLNNSIVVRDFQGQLGSTVQCMTCNAKSVTFNTFMYLSLPIPNISSRTITLIDCINKYLEKEALDGSDAWMCTKCKVPRRSSKQLWLSKLPHVLMIHLKRFYYQGPFRNKVDTFVDFPLRSLDLSPILKVKDQQTGINYVYDLYAISNHYGGLNGGHYTAFVRSGYRQGQWYHFDDSRVSPMSENEVKSKAAYLLFYVRRG